MSDLADRVIFRMVSGKQIGMLKCPDCGTDTLVELYTAMRPVALQRRKSDKARAYAGR